MTIGGALIRQAFVTLDFFCELPDDELEADRAFDVILDNVVRAVNDAEVSDVDPAGFIVRDADTVLEV